MSATASLAAASVRARPSAFAGTFAALVFSGAVVTACVSVAVSAAGAPPVDGDTGLSEMGVGFSLVSVYLSVFVIAQAVSLAVAQRHRESALLRAVGAEPRQIRRMVAAEALAAALLALPVGYGLGALLAEAWFRGMDRQGLVPEGVVLHIGLWPLLAAFGVLLVSSQLGGLAGAWRASRTRPAAVLTRSQVQGGERPGAVRGLASLVFLGGAVALTAAAGAGSAEDAGSEIPLVLLAYMVAIGLAGPWIGRLATAVAAPLLRGCCGVAGELAVAGSRARSRRLSSAITPIALVTAFAVAKLVSLTGSGDPAWMDVFGTLLYAGFAGLVAANTLVMLTLERLREFSLLRVVGAGRRRIVAVVLAEGAITALAGAGAGVFAACAVMVPLGPKTGTPLSGLPGWVWAVSLSGCAALVWTASCAPLGHLLRVRPLAGLARRSV
ncbi:FtsX-like permease family protein [Streptomyces sp. NPDC050560]|uniref:FtsX-like permease family protein n=1 Tax=Streptomyces sp. NPDC050560 TaxID=3365630 RepID=UPI00379285EC